MALPLSDAKVAVVRDRVLEGVVLVLRSGEDLTFANVARSAGVPERTIYRYFPNREALLTALFQWTNARLGFEEKRPDDAANLLEFVRVVFAGFDELAPIIHELLVAPEGRVARLSVNSARKRAALHLVGREAPELDAASRRRVAAVVQLLTSAAAWQSLREYWGMNGAEAAEAAALGLELILAGARARRAPTARSKRRSQGSTSKRREAP